MLRMPHVITSTIREVPLETRFRPAWQILHFYSVCIIGQRQLDSRVEHPPVGGYFWLLVLFHLLFFLGVLLSFHRLGFRRKDGVKTTRRTFKGAAGQVFAPTLFSFGGCNMCGIYEERERDARREWLRHAGNRLWSHHVRPYS
ncbi:hypothetical protein F4680DRAFT_407517 [Xylaria scruposa]|nr:hypothetical protein F4680DRAFT_407517 [Xylaria scruposa]